MDAGEREAEIVFQRIKREINRIYGQAQRELRKKLVDFASLHHLKDALKRKQLELGEITLADYARWQRLEIWREKRFKTLLANATETLKTANEKALKIINGERLDVFARNINYQNFLADQAGIASNWTIYDSSTVARIIKEQPTLLPPKKLNPEKDIAWNLRAITDCITQGIIQGESIEDVAERIAKVVVPKNQSQMLRTARTAMTSAQNAGRIEAMQEQEKMGIRVKKQWIATLDYKTRDSHQYLDGDIADIDEPFKSILGPIRFPGDPEAAPANVYNCRCRLGYEYPGYPKKNRTRRDNITGDVIEWQTYREWCSRIRDVKRQMTEDGLIEAIENRERYGQGVVR